jgi:uncharacterized protein
MTEPAAPLAQPAAPLWEVAAVVSICFGWFISLSLSAVSNGFPTGGFSDGSLQEMLVLELILGGLALAFLRLRGYAIRGLLPRPTVRGGAHGVGLLIAAYAAWYLVYALIGSPRVQGQPIEQIMSDTRVTLPTVLALSFVNGWFEEAFLVGYIVAGLRSHGAAIAIGVSILVRLLYHLYQGPLGAVSVLAYGLVVTLFYWHTRALWPVMFAHMLADLTALA